MLSNDLFVCITYNFDRLIIFTSLKLEAKNLPPDKKGSPCKKKKCYTTEKEAEPHAHRAFRHRNEWRPQGKLRFLSRGGYRIATRCDKKHKLFSQLYIQIEVRTTFVPISCGECNVSCFVASRRCGSKLPVSILP
jgi:hypothetical protein